MLTLFHHPMFATCRFIRLCFAEYGEELALIVVHTLLDYVSKRGYALFGWWRLVVGILGLAALTIWG
jgi:undecaprenyl pyrophosphate phosphatase UppP